MKKLPRSGGQVLLIVLLGVASVLFLVLSVASRSITDISFSTREDASSKAFSAAEAGIENALLGSFGPGSFSDAGYDVTAGNAGQGADFYNFPQDLKSGESGNIWFIGHESNGNFTATGRYSGASFKLCWGAEGTNSSQPDTPAVEVSIFYDTNLGLSLGSNPDYSNIRVARAAYDPNSGRNGVSGNGFTQAGTTSCTIGGRNYAFSVDSVVVPGGYPLSANIKMIYNTQPHGFGIYVAPGTLPSQGTIISSTGTSGGVVRKVELVQTYSEPPGVFLNGIYSGSSAQ